jgi:putative ABC transport system permease protein
VRSLSLAIHTTIDPLALSNAVQRLVIGLDPNQPVYRIRTMGELMSESLARRRLSMFLLAVFACIALLLAAVGIYGVMSYTVATRAHEVGIRMALGACRVDVVRLILGHSFWLTGTGIVFGVAGSLSLTRFLSTLLFQVQTFDPLTFTLVTLGLGAVAILASLIPTWRAATIDPVYALRQD